MSSLGGIRVPCQSHITRAPHRQALSYDDGGLCAQEVCLHALVAGDHDNAVILAALRRLRAPHVLRLIAYLSKLAMRLPGQPNFDSTLILSCLEGPAQLVI